MEMLGSKFVNLDSGVDFQPNKLESFHSQELEACCSLHSSDFSFFLVGDGDRSIRLWVFHIPANLFLDFRDDALWRTKNRCGENLY